MFDEIFEIGVVVKSNGYEVYRGDLYDFLKDKQFDVDIFYACLSLVITEKIKFNTPDYSYEITRTHIKYV